MNEPIEIQEPIPMDGDDTRAGALLTKAIEESWSPLLDLGEIRVSLYADGTIEFRDGQTIYVHLNESETCRLLQWIDGRDKL